MFIIIEDRFDKGINFDMKEAQSLADGVMVRGTRCNQPAHSSFLKRPAPLPLPVHQEI